MSALPVAVRRHLGWIGLVLLAVSANPQPAQAGRITFQVETHCRESTAGGICRVTLRHLGDEEAVELETTLELDGRPIAHRAIESLRPGNQQRIDLEFDRAELLEGRNPLVVRVGYHDQGGYPLEVLSHSSIVIGDIETSGNDSGPGSAPARGAGTLQQIEASLGDLVLERTRRETDLWIRNRGGETLDLDLRVIAPRTLSVAEPRRTIELGAGETARIPLALENRSSFAGSSLRFYALLEAESGGRRRSLFVPATVHVRHPRGPAASRMPAMVSALVLLAVGWAAAQRRGPSSIHPRSPWAGRALDATMLVVIALFLLAYFRPELLLSPTTATGGDMASHYPTLRFLVEELLPSGRILGWMQGNLAGFPIFQLYFPFPFLVMAGMSTLVPLPVAFKVGTVLGVFLLPASAFIFLSLLRFRRPIPILGAVLTLPFLFVEAHSVWGGNIPSTLAGEFTYSWGLALTLIFGGLCYRALSTGSGVVASGLVLAAVALSHAYCLLLAGLLTASWVLFLDDRRRVAIRLATIYLFGFCLAGFWFLPLLAYAGFTTPYSDIWRIESWRQVVPVILWPGVALAGALALTAIWRKRRSDDAWRLRPRVAALLSLPVAGGVLFYLAPSLGGVDIRFLPFVQLSIGLAAAVALGRAIRSRPATGAAVLIASLGVVIWSDTQVTYIPQWIEWNYSGFESRPLWADFEATNDFLAGDLSNPRVVFEHSPAHNAAGSIRAFESLPHFSGRSTLEGLYIQSGLLTPEIFYLQSEISAVASCPLPEWRCGRLDPERAVEHLRQMNVSQVVARSARVKELLEASDDYSRQATHGPYEVFRVEGGGDGYVVPLDRRPIALVSETWKEEFFEWFRQPGSSGTVLVRLDEREHRELRHLIRQRVSSAGEVTGSENLDASGVEIEEQIDQGTIRFRTNRPGHPVLIRVAYHPRWQVEGADRVLLASPGFMLVYPRGHEVTLRFGAPPLVRSGWALTAAAWLALAAFAIWRGLRWRKGSASRGAEAVGLRPVRAPNAVRSSVSWVALVPMVAALLTIAVFTRQARDEVAPHLFDQGMEAYRQSDNVLAVHYFDRAVSLSPRSSAAQRASFFGALSLYREERWEEALERFEGSIRDYPESGYRAEAEYHVGLVLRRLGRHLPADDAFRRVASAFPDTPWGRRAQERLESSS